MTRIILSALLFASLGACGQQSSGLLQQKEQDPQTRLKTLKEYFFFDVKTHDEYADAVGSWVDTFIANSPEMLTNGKLVNTGNAYISPLLMSKTYAGKAGFSHYLGLRLKTDVIAVPKLKGEILTIATLYIRYQSIVNVIDLSANPIVVDRKEGRMTSTPRNYMLANDLVLQLDHEDSVFVEEDHGSGKVIDLGEKLAYMPQNRQNLSSVFREKIEDLPGKKQTSLPRLGDAFFAKNLAGVLSIVGEMSIDEAEQRPGSVHPFDKTRKGLLGEIIKVAEAKVLADSHTISSFTLLIEKLKFYDKQLPEPTHDKAGIFN